MTMKTGEIVKLQRSSDYWAGRAGRHRREGNRRRAAALLRHAVALSPADSDLREEYARALQEMACYEASNRAAFGALTLDPRRYACYGLIGRNMLALGYEQEAMDAFSRYLIAVRRAGGVAEFDDELDELESYESDPPKVRARYEVQLSIAGRRLARADYDGAEHALKLAKPAQDADDRYNSLHALLLQARGDHQGAVLSAQRACRRNPESVRARCTLAGAYSDAGRRAKAASTLLQAALRCETAQDEQLFCYSATSLELPGLALSMLRKALKRNPDRLPTVYDACVTMLRLGRMDDAEAYLHHCRDLDPSDVPARLTGRAIAQWRELCLSPGAVARSAKQTPFYPALSPAARNDGIAELALALGDGVDTFCQRLTQDENLYNLYLYALGDAEHQLGRLLPLLAARLPRDFAEKLLREALVQSTPDDGAKRFAAMALMALGAKPPYVIWHAGRIAEIDPFVQNRRDANLTRVMLVRRMADIQQKTGDARLMTHALHLLFRMGARRRSLVVRDADGVFRAALEQHYLISHSLPDSQRLEKMLQYTADGRRKVRAAFRMFCRLIPIPTERPLPYE